MCVSFGQFLGYIVLLLLQHMTLAGYFSDVSSLQSSTAQFPTSRYPVDDDNPKLSGSSSLASLYWILHVRPRTLKPKSSEPKTTELKLGVLLPLANHQNEVKLGKAPAPNSIVLKLQQPSMFGDLSYLIVPPNPAGKTIFCKFVQYQNPPAIQFTVSCVPEPSGNSMLDKLVQQSNMLDIFYRPLRAPPSSSDMSIELKLEHPLSMQVQSTSLLQNPLGTVNEDIHAPQNMRLAELPTQDNASFGTTMLLAMQFSNMLSQLRHSRGSIVIGFVASRCMSNIFSPDRYPLKLNVRGMYKGALTSMLSTSSGIWLSFTSAGTSTPLLAIAALNPACASTTFCTFSTSVLIMLSPPKLCQLDLLCLQDWLLASRAK